MANENEKTGIGWKDVIWILLIVVSGLVTYFTTTGSIQNDITKLQGKDIAIELQIQSNEIFVRDDIREIKEDMKDMKDNDLREIKENIQTLIDLRMRGNNSSGN